MSESCVASTPCPKRPSSCVPHFIVREDHGLANDVVLRVWNPPQNPMKIVARKVYVPGPSGTQPVATYTDSNEGSGQTTEFAGALTTPRLSDVELTTAPFESSTSINAVAELVRNVPLFL